MKRKRFSLEAGFKVSARGAALPVNRHHSNIIPPKAPYRIRRKEAVPLAQVSFCLLLEILFIYDVVLSLFFFEGRKGGRR
jgi:hypothetical protein